jgi:spermidine/putrescine transport system permease protein
MAAEAPPVVRPAPLGLRARRRPGLSTAGLLSAPLFWLVFFFVVPVCIAIVYSLGLLSFFPGEEDFSLEFWKDFIDGSAYLDLFWKSAKVSAIVAVFTVVLAYPIAYYLALCSGTRKYVLLFVIIAPYLVSYFLRLFSMKVVLGDDGVINSIFYATGLRDEDNPIPGLIYSQTAVIITLVVIYIPFVAIPIFVALENLDRRLLEAASDLGASRVQTFLRVTLPLSLPGVIAGFIFVFIPTLGEYFTPLIVGGTTGYLFGNSISDLFGPSLDWQTGSVLSIFLIGIVVILMATFSRFLSTKTLSTR